MPAVSTGRVRELEQEVTGPRQQLRPISLSLPPGVNISGEQHPPIRRKLQTLQMPVTTYAIGDVHGRLDLLENLLDMVEADAAAIGTRAKIVLTGDFVDRGENSFGVVERLMKGPRRSGDEFVCLRGNHDELFVRSVLVGEGLPHWAVTLFAFTIGSYGHSSETWRDSLEIRRHAEHLAELPLIHDDGANLFVHAGIRPGVAIEDQAE